MSVHGSSITLVGLCVHHCICGTLLTSSVPEMKEEAHPVGFGALLLMVSMIYIHVCTGIACIVKTAFIDCTCMHILYCLQCLY